VESIGPQIALASSVPGLLDLADIKSAHDYFELLQRGGVIDNIGAQKNGVGAGIVTFNIVAISVFSKIAGTTILSDFGTVRCCA
jgi:hypothetical protein